MYPTLMSDHNSLLDEARIADVEKFYLDMGSEAASSDPIAASIAAQVETAKLRVTEFLEQVKGKPVALVTVCFSLNCSFFCSLANTLPSVWWYNDSS